MVQARNIQRKKAPRWQPIIFMWIFAGLLCFFTVLGATKASVDHHIYLTIGQSGVIALAFIAGGIFNVGNNFLSLKNKLLLNTVIAPVFISAGILYFIDMFYDASLVSNRSYAHTIGTLITCFYATTILSMLKYFALFIHALIKDKDHIKKYCFYVLLSIIALGIEIIFFQLILIQIIASFLDAYSVIHLALLAILSILIGLNLYLQTKKC